MAKIELSEHSTDKRDRGGFKVNELRTAMNKKCVGFTVAALCLCSSLQAQSILSLEYPGGVPLAHSTGSSLGMEGAGVGVQNDYFGMGDNIANIGATNRAVFSGVASLNLLEIRDNGATGHLASAMPRLLSFEIPVSLLGTFGFSFDERSSSNISTSNTGMLSTGVADTSRIVSTGGIKAWQVGWGRAIERLAFVGVSYERLYCSNNYFARYTSNDPTQTDGFPLCDTNQSSSASNGLRAGVLVPIQKFTVGLSGEYVFDGAGTARFSRTSVLDSAVGLFIDSNSHSYTFVLPSSVSAGVSWTPDPRWLIAAAGSMTFWSRHSYLLPANLDNSGSYTVSNTASVSAGAQFTPAPNMLMPQYWQIMQYRAGIRYSQLPDGTSSETAFTLGVGLPLLSGSGLLDINAEFGTRSDTRFGGYSENFLQFSVGLDGGRQWSQNTGVRY
jgi:hypothetical protein